MVNKREFSKRLNKLLEFYEISASGLATKIGVQRSSISHLLSGRNNPSLEFILKVMDNYSEVTFDWLVRGKGKLETKIHNSPTPTLFDQDISNSKSTTNLADNNKPEAIKNTFAENLINESKNKKVSKIVLFYKDGSFDYFTNE